MDHRYEVKRWGHKVYLKFIWLLPRKLVMWCAIRLIAHATTGKYSNQIVPELTAMEAIDRWDIDNGCS